MPARGKVFILESPGPVDLLAERAERFSLERVCKLFGHQAVSFLLRDAVELKQTLMYVSLIVRYPKLGKSPLFTHVSLHGDGDHISVGNDKVSWIKLANMVSRSYKNLDEYEGPIILIVSACGGNEQKLTWLLSQKQSCLSMKVRSPMPCSCSCLSPTRSQRRRRELHGADSDMA